MEKVVELKNVSKEFKMLNRREGLVGGVKDLFSRDYKIVHAVHDISMSIKRGEVVGYLGPNGAGKSTTIKMMTGVLEPSAGKIIVNGQEPYKNRNRNAKNIGVVFGQRSQLWWSLPLIESFKLLKDIYQVSNTQYKDMLELYDSLIDIKDLCNKPVRQMSLGQRTLSDILAAFLHDPSVVYLDEPTIGLDVSMKSKIRELVKGLNKEKGTTVILTTHDMGDVDALCKRIVIIDKGAMLYDNNIDNLKSFFGDYRTMKLKFSKKDEDISEEIFKNISQEINNAVSLEFSKAKSISVNYDDEWVNILFKENEVSMMKILNFIQEKKQIHDMKLEEISTESVIKKIYEGGIK